MHFESFQVAYNVTIIIWPKKIHNVLILFLKSGTFFFRFSDLIVMPKSRQKMMDRNTGLKLENSYV